MEFEFNLTFYDTFGTFSVDADNYEEAYNKASNMIMKVIKNLPVEVEFDVDCVREPDNKEDDDEYEDEY